MSTYYYFKKKNGIVVIAPQLTYTYQETMFSEEKHTAQWEFVCYKNSKRSQAWRLTPGILAQRQEDDQMDQLPWST